MDIEDVVGALKSSFRRRILHRLSRGSLRYSELMKSVGVEPEDSGWFAYHLKVLVDAGLVSRNGEMYYLSRVGRKAVLLLREVSKKEDSISVRFLEGMSRISFLDELKAVWALILLTFSIYFLSNSNQGLVGIMIGFCLLFSSILLYASIAFSARSIYVLPVFLNIWWFIVKPERWRWIASIYVLWMTSMLIIANLGSILYASIPIALAAVLSGILYYKQSKASC